MVQKKLIALIFLFLMFFSASAYVLYFHLTDISKPYPQLSINEEPATTQLTDTVRVGVISRFPSNILYSGYQPLMDFLTNETGFYFELVVNRSYSETVRNLGLGKVDAAFLGSFIYLTSRDTYGLIPIIKPLNEDGKPFFRSHIVVREDSDINSISDLKGKRLALPSEQSFSANWLLAYGFEEKNLSVDDLELLSYLDHHHTVIYEVMRSSYHAGSVKDRVAREFENRGIRIVASSDPVPGSPLVVSKRTNENVTQAIKQALLGIDINNPEHQKMMAGWDPEFLYGFTEAKASDYDSMNQRLGGVVQP